MTSDIKLPHGQKPITRVNPCPRLLVVCDLPIYSQSLFEIFRPDHDVFFACNGDQAMEICQNSLPDLILLDIVMPGMEGLAVCRQLKSDPDTKDVPVILMTNHDDIAAETKALAAGAADFISKPINPTVVRSRVNTHLTLKAQSDLLKSLAFIDGPTGVASRRRFDAGLEAEWRRCRRLITPLALLLIGIHNFKKISNSRGKETGDICLQEVATILKGQTGRSHDLLARYGNEEFACLLPDIYFDGALQKAEAMVRAVRDSALSYAPSETDTAVTICIGVAVTIPGPDRQPNALLSIVETQLYEAKRQGPNQVCGLELPGYFSNTLK